MLVVRMLVVPQAHKKFGNRSFSAAGGTVERPYTWTMAVGCVFPSV